MNPTDILLSALGSLRANILRTVLTTLGIIIGVAAVIAMVAVGSGSQEYMDRLIQNLGSNILIVRNGTSVSGGARGGEGTSISLTESDARAMETELNSVRIAAGVVRGAAQAVSGNTNWYTTVQGAGPGYLEARDWTIVDGRTFTDSDFRSAAKVALVGQTVVKKLFDGEIPLGQPIRIRRIPFIVVGVVGPKGQTPFGSDQDDVIFIPLATAKKRVFGGNRTRGDFVDSIVVKADSPEALAVAETEITELLRLRHRISNGKPDDFSVRNISQILETRAKAARTMSFLLAAVAMISLIVGGIGIMNIMLVSVTERTREIGLRMAVGARARDVMVQFVIEAVAISLIGGVIGIVLGVGGSLIAGNVAGYQMAPSFLSVVMAMGFSAVVGVFFGYYPALKASRLDPIEALRHE